MNSKNNILVLQTSTSKTLPYDRFESACYFKQASNKQLSFIPRQYKNQTSSYQTIQSKLKEEDEEFNKLYTNLSYFLSGLMLLILLLTFCLKPFLAK